MLIVLHGPDAGVVYPVVDEIVLGRSEGASIYVDDEKVSRRHARLVAVGPEQIRLEDLGSKNGTWLNGQRLTDAAVLSDGDNIQIGDRAAFHFVLRDTLERRVIERQKMEAIGRIAGRTAHAFNNLLSVALCGLSQLRDMSQEQPGIQKDIIADTIDALGRAAELSQQLLGLARHPLPLSEPIDVAGFVEDLGRMFRRTLCQGQNLVLELDPDALIQGDRAQLQQALLNLCINAREAMTDGGTITLRAGRRRVGRQDEPARNDGVPPGDYVELAVRDTGCGIDPFSLKHIFEPFFTTKKEGQASGLGLAIVLAIVHSHGGTVAVRSAPGQGTELTLFIPALASRLSAADPTALERVRDPSSASRTILLVDDDPAVRRSVTRMLEHLGHRVHVASDGAEAVALYRSRAASVDLVLLDLAMPVRDGASVLADLRAINPEVRVILSSGFHGDALDITGVLGFLPKPYTLQQVSEALRAAN